MFRDRIRKALAKAIRNFYTINELYSDKELEEAASEFVYNHDMDVLQHIKDTIDLDCNFADALDELDIDEIF